MNLVSWEAVCLTRGGLTNRAEIRKPSGAPFCTHIMLTRAVTVFGYDFSPHNIDRSMQSPSSVSRSIAEGEGAWEHDPGTKVGGMSPFWIGH